MQNVVAFPMHTHSDERSEVLADVALKARTQPEAFKRLIIIAQGETGRPVIWMRGVDDFEAAALLDIAHHAALEKALYEEEPA